MQVVLLKVVRFGWDRITLMLHNSMLHRRKLWSINRDIDIAMDVVMDVAALWGPICSSVVALQIVWYLNTVQLVARYTYCQWNMMLYIC